MLAAGIAALLGVAPGNLTVTPLAPGGSAVLSAAAASSFTAASAPAPPRRRLVQLPPPQRGPGRARAAGPGLPPAASPALTPQRRPRAAQHMHGKRGAAGAPADGAGRDPSLGLEGPLFHGGLRVDAHVAAERVEMQTRGLLADTLDEAAEGDNALARTLRSYQERRRAAIGQLGARLGGRLPQPAQPDREEVPLQLEALGLGLEAGADGDADGRQADRRLKELARLSLHQELHLRPHTSGLYNMRKHETPQRLQLAGVGSDPAGGGEAGVKLRGLPLVGEVREITCFPNHKRQNGKTGQKGTLEATFGFAD